MANAAQAVEAISGSLNNEFSELTNLMADIADGNIDGQLKSFEGTITRRSDGGYETFHIPEGQPLPSLVEFSRIASDAGSIAPGTTRTVSYEARTGYKLGGQQIGIGGLTTDPGTMLQISTATSVQQVYTGALTDGAMKISQVQQAVSRKVG